MLHLKLKNYATQGEVDDLGEAVVQLRKELDELKKRLPPGIVAKPEAKPRHVTSGNVHRVLRELELRDAQEEKGATHG
jgi:hypothetical protein